MPIIKTMKAEKVSTETLATKAMDVCREMLSIICDRTNKDGEDDSMEWGDEVMLSAQHHKRGAALLWKRTAAEDLESC